MNLTLQAISHYLAKQGIPNNRPNNTTIEPHIIIEHGKSYYDFSTIYINPKTNTITIIKDWSKDHTTIHLADPQLLPKILQTIHKHKHQYACTQ